MADTLLCRHLMPGHAFECLWFVLREAVHSGETVYVAQAVQSMKRMFALGWDNEYGGLLRYIDREGGQPHGRLLAEDKYQQLIADTWDFKLWWPHSEALYALLLACKLTDDRDLAALYEQLHQYTFATFPHPDPAVGEWIQIRDRTGRPSDKVVALPVKDPFHLLRNFFMVIELLHTTSGGDFLG